MCAVADDSLDAARWMLFLPLPPTRERDCRPASWRKTALPDPTLPFKNGRRVCAHDGPGRTDPVMDRFTHAPTSCAPDGEGVGSKVSQLGTRLAVRSGSNREAPASGANIVEAV
jgi:hypothetical protein